MDIKEFTINIIETAEYAFTIKANSEEQATEKAYQLMYEGEGLIEKSYKDYCNLLTTKNIKV